MQSIPSRDGYCKRASALVLLMIGIGLPGCVSVAKYERDITETIRSCESAIEVLTDMCKAELIKQKKDRGLRF